MNAIKTILMFSMLFFLSLPVIVTTVSAEVIHTPEGAIITHYPNKFDGIGTISSVDDRGIVIDDMFVPFAPHVRYMTPQSVYSSLGPFRHGQKVGYILNDKKQIIKLCLFLGKSPRKEIKGTPE